MYLPLAADPVFFTPMDDSKTLDPYRADLSFLGSGYPNRRSLFAQLLDYDFKIWGTEWDLETEVGRRVQDQGRRIPPEETVRIYNAARINLNLHSSVFNDGLDAEGAFVNPRTFEVAACGAFQLVDHRPLLEDHFLVGKEIAAFNGMSDLRRKIEFYLKEPELRREMGHLARKRVLAEHTYLHRMETLLDFISQSQV